MMYEDGNVEYLSILLYSVAFSLHAIADVRRRHEMIFFGISGKLLKLSTSKFNMAQALDSLYISTGNDFNSYFWSTANRINVFILGRDFSITVQPILQKFTVWETVIQGLH